MVTTLYLIRHGETIGAEIKRYKGSIDVPLSENGVRQIEKTAELVVKHLGKETISAVYSSDLSRAVCSAEIIGKPFGIAPVKTPAIRERSFGLWEGMSFDEIRNAYPVEFQAWSDNPLTHSPIGGESTIDVSSRVVKAIDEIIEKHKGKRIAVVAHGGVNRVILCRILGVPLENVFRIEQDFAALNIVEFWDDYPVVKAMNLLAYEVERG